MIIFIMQLLFFLLLVAHPTLQFSVDRSSDDDCFCGLENTPPLSRILDGNVTAPNQYPWMVRLGGCGGSLISNRHVLTAYHCGFDKTVKVSTHHQYDENDYEEVAVEKWVYPDKKVVGSHDIAILVLDKPVTFDREIHPVCLPTSDDFVWKGEKVTAMGWGKTFYKCAPSPKLKHVDMIVGDLHKNKNWFSTKYMTGKGTCGGDSGGPVCHQDPATKRWTIIGTVWGGGWSGKKCSGSKKTIWNTVSSHMEWINKILNETPNTSRCAPKPVTSYPVNGGWSKWGSCSKSCGSGRQTRTCTNPEPTKGGSTCAGSISQLCNTEKCPDWKQNSTTDCWYKCGKKGGLCENFCGPSGHCCRKGYDDCPAAAGDASPKHHTCVAPFRVVWKRNSTNDCWFKCGKKGGLCENFCGSNGYCCRDGYGGCPAAAGGASPGRHTCVKQVPRTDC